MKLWLAIVFLVLPQFAACQTIQIDAGGSTLLPGDGAGITLFRPDSTTYFGAGVSNGRFVFGASRSFKLRDYKVTAGDRLFGFGFDGAGLGLAERGIAVEKHTDRSTLTAFAGSAGLAFNAPYVRTQRSQHIGVGLFAEKKFDHFQVDGLGAVDGGKHSAVGGLSYKSNAPKHNPKPARCQGSGCAHFRFPGAFEASLSGGMLENRKYFDAQASYRTKYVGLSAAHQNFVLLNQWGRSDAAFVYSSFGIFSLHAGINRSQFLRSSSAGGSGGVGVRLGWITAQSDIYRTGFQQSKTLISHSLREQLGHFGKFYLSQSVIQSDKNSLTFGGGYRANRFSASVDHNVVFTVLGFQRTTSVQLSFRLHDALLSFGNLVDITGRSRWTTYGSDYIQTAMGASASAGFIGGNEFRGRVVDDQNQPVRGVAIRVGKQLVYSNQDGTFTTRTKQREAALSIDWNESVALGEWACLECPALIKSEETVRIVVKRK